MYVANVSIPTLQRRGGRIPEAVAIGASASFHYQRRIDLPATVRPSTTDTPPEAFQSSGTVKHNTAIPARPPKRNRKISQYSSRIGHKTSPPKRPPTSRKSKQTGPNIPIFPIASSKSEAEIFTVQATFPFAGARQFRAFPDTQFRPQNNTRSQMLRTSSQKTKNHDSLRHNFNSATFNQNNPLRTNEYYPDNTLPLPPDRCCPTIQPFDRPDMGMTPSFYC